MCAWSDVCVQAVSGTGPTGAGPRGVMWPEGRRDTSIDAARPGDAGARERTSPPAVHPRAPRGASLHLESHPLLLEFP